MEKRENARWRRGRKPEFEERLVEDNVQIAKANLPVGNREGGVQLISTRPDRAGLGITIWS